MTQAETVITLISTYGKAGAQAEIKLYTKVMRKSEIKDRLNCTHRKVGTKGMNISWEGLCSRNEYIMRTQTSFYLQVINFTSHYTTTRFLFVCLFCFVLFLSLYSAGTQHGNLHLARWPISFCGPTQEPVSAAANIGKTWERFWKNAGEWTGRVEISEEEIPGSKRSMHGNILTNSRL